MLQPRSIALLLAATVSLEAGTIVYSDFGPGNSFNQAGSTCVSGATSGCGQQYWVAASFTPAGDYILSQIDLALGNFSGTSGAQVKLVQDAGGSPGTMALQSWAISPLPSVSLIPNLPVSPVTSAGNVLLHSGTKYWVVVQPAATDTFAGWFANNTNVFGGYAIATNGSSWNNQIFSTPAFDVQGTATPEPNTFQSMGAALLGLLGAFAGMSRSSRWQVARRTAAGSEEARCPRFS